MTETAERGAAADTPVVEVVSSSTTTSLVVRYDGAHPPTPLFAAWAGLGWQAPVPASPPRDAIDWSTPDPVRGTNHTIRSFPATGTATLDDARRRDARRLVQAAVEVAASLGCRVEHPVPDEIDLREPSERSPGPLVDLTTPAEPRVRPTVRAALRRRSGGAQARVRATIPSVELDEVHRVVDGLGGSIEHAPEPATRADDEPLSRVTVAVAASAGDAVMRSLAARSTGTPTIEIVTAGAAAPSRGA